MRTYWQAEFTDFRGNKTLFKFKFATRVECEQFIRSQRKPNMRAVEIVPEDPRPEQAPEQIDQAPHDVPASVEGDDHDAMHMLTAADLTRLRKRKALEKARAAKAAKRASMAHVEHAA